FVLCATDWIGMATEDIPNAATILVDLSNFPTLTDRLQQSMLDQLFLARLMIHPQGFVSNAAFQDAFGNPVIDTSHVFYDVNRDAHHITSDPLPNTPPHKSLVHEAFGDHQVANVATEVEARTLGLSIYQPALAPGRHTDVHPYFGIPAIPSFPFDGSAMVVWDSGVPPPPITNTPPTAGSDPHGKPRSQATARQQKSEFLEANGTVVDGCGGNPWPAP